MLRVGESSGRLDLAAVLKLIAARGMTRLMVEGGPTLAAALLAADLVDEAILFHSANVVGADGIDALDAGGHGGAERAVQARNKRSQSGRIGKKSIARG